jgi:hypothetical protein
MQEDVEKGQATLCYIGCLHADIPTGQLEVALVVISSKMKRNEKILRDHFVWIEEEPPLSLSL